MGDVCAGVDRGLTRVRGADRGTGIRRDSGPSAAFRKGVGIFMHAPRSEALRLGHSAALPRAGETDPRHAVASFAMGRQVFWG